MMGLPAVFRRSLGKVRVVYQHVACRSFGCGRFGSPLVHNAVVVPRLAYWVRHGDVRPRLWARTARTAQRPWGRFTRHEQYMPYATRAFASYRSENGSKSGNVTHHGGKGHDEDESEYEEMELPEEVVQVAQDLAKSEGIPMEEALNTVLEAIAEDDDIFGDGTGMKHMFEREERDIEDTDLAWGDPSLTPDAAERHAAGNDGKDDWMNYLPESEEEMKRLEALVDDLSGGPVDKLMETVDGAELWDEASFEKHVAVQKKQDVMLDKLKGLQKEAMHHRERVVAVSNEAVMAWRKVVKGSRFSKKQLRRYATVLFSAKKAVQEKRDDDLLALHRRALGRSSGKDVPSTGGVHLRSRKGSQTLRPDGEMGTMEISTAFDAQGRRFLVHKDEALTASSTSVVRRGDMELAVEKDAALSDDGSAITELVTRFPLTFASVHRVLSDVRDMSKRRTGKDFVPTSLLDYGSGVGAAVFAARSVWDVTNDVFDFDAEAFAKGSVDQRMKFAAAAGAHEVHDCDKATMDGDGNHVGCEQIPSAPRLEHGEDSDSEGTSDAPGHVIKTDYSVGDDDLGDQYKDVNIIGTRERLLSGLSVLPAPIMYSVSVEHEPGRASVARKMLGATYPHFRDVRVHFAARQTPHVQNIEDVGKGATEPSEALDALLRTGNLASSLGPDASGEAAAIMHPMRRARVSMILPPYSTASVVNASSEVADGTVSRHAKGRFDLVTWVVDAQSANQLRTRKRLLRSLWERTDRYLVVIDEPTAAGFDNILKLRDHFIKSLAHESVMSFDASNKSEQVVRVGRVAAPCPHEKECPLAASLASSVRKRLWTREGDHEGDGYPGDDNPVISGVHGKHMRIPALCSSKQRIQLPLEHVHVARKGGTGKPVIGSRRAVGNWVDRRFCYLVLERVHPREQNQTSDVPRRHTSEASNGDEHTMYETFGARLDDDKWSHIVATPLKRARHLMLPLCTPDGSYTRPVLSRTKHKWPYKLSRRLEAGDKWPLHPTQDDAFIEERKRKRQEERA